MRRISYLWNDKHINPDIVLISGDIIDANCNNAIWELNNIEYSFKKIKSKYGVYASLGEHHYDENGDSADMINRFKQAGINVLRDSGILIEI